MWLEHVMTFIVFWWFIHLSLVISGGISVVQKKKNTLQKCPLRCPPSGKKCDICPIGCPFFCTQHNEVPFREISQIKCDQASSTGWCAFNCFCPILNLPLVSLIRPYKAFICVRFIMFIWHKIKLSYSLHETWSKMKWLFHTSMLSFYISLDVFSYLIIRAWLIYIISWSGPITDVSVSTYKLSLLAGQNPMKDTVS